MHQYSRPPPETASPASSERTNPTRTNNPRDRDVQNLRNDSPPTQNSGSSDDFSAARQEQPADNAVAQIQRLNQVIQNFHTKAALIILHSRVDLPPAYSKGKEERRVNRWFNIELDETDDYKDDIRRWKTCDLKENRPPPLVIEILLNTDGLNQSQRLVILDEDGRRYDVMNALAASQDGRHGKRRASTDNEVVLERWLIQLHDHNSGPPPDLAQILPLVYKKSIVLFRSLFTYCNFLPAWKLSKKIGKARSSTGLKLSYRILDGSQISMDPQSDSLRVPLGDSSAEQLADYQFGVTDSPAGPFSVHVTYRNNCEFRVDDSEAVLSSRFATSDDELFPPSLPREEQIKKSQDVGSLPNDHRENLFKTSELGQAYGSLGTFHQAGIASGTSPISALRNAQDYTSRSPPSAHQERLQPSQVPEQNFRSALAGAGLNRAGKRTSFSFQPFKSPVLSASPMGVSPLSSSPRVVSGRLPVLGSLTEESYMPPSATHGHRRTVSLAPERAIPSSISSSPKPAPVTKFSSSFGHRRARVSSGGTTTKTDEDQNSSGKISGTSSTQQPGSGLMAEARSGGSSGSMQEDDENISDFLKMLDLKKDLLSPQDAAAAEVSSRRNTAALNRFHKMRDTNAALSDSISSSQMLHRSSTSSSRQLSSVPPMVAATSVSTSSSPGKPTSPHTPHTPFAPSRLSAAYSHDDTAHNTHLSIPEEDATSPVSGNTSETTNVPAAIDIPNSPRPFQPYRRSISAQRPPPLPDDDDIGDLYGMRSGSMGANAHPISRRTSERSAEAPPLDLDVPSRGGSISRNSNLTPNVAALNDGAASTTQIQHRVYRSRLARGAGRGSTATPPQGSTSSFGGTDRGAGSAEGSGGSGSWGARGGSMRRRGSRTENKFSPEEEEGQDDFLPFAMERSELK
jgi:autophagy-related protein 13